MLPLTWLIIVLAALTAAANADPTCQHQHPRHDEVLQARTEREPRVKKRSVQHPLRILIFYDQSLYNLTYASFAVVNDSVLPEAVRWWEQALMVREPSSRVWLSHRCQGSQVFVKDGFTHCIDGCRPVTLCGEAEVPAAHLDDCRSCDKTGLNCTTLTKRGEGVEGADFVLYVSAVQTERCNRSLTVAYAAHCQQEPHLDRPVAGHANLCPASISNGPQEVDTLLSTVKHEILHALGFSVSLFAFYRDEKGKPALNEELQTYRWSDSIVRSVTRPAWSIRGGSVERDVHMIVTPRVVDEVRDHFACPQLEGAELEDQGKEGTALTHWEKRVFENEAMTGTHTQNPVVSRITLALMEDTGWYVANYSMAEPLTWGKGLGCDFVMKSCKEWISARTHAGLSIHPFCNKVKRDPLQTECTDDRSSVALCNLLNYTEELPKMYQNFDSIQHVPAGMEGYYGGSVTLADYCPYIQEFTWRSKNVVVRGSHCHYADNNPKRDKNFALEQYGERSKCFEHSDEMWEERSCRLVRQWQHWGSGCYEYSCLDGRLHIKVLNYTYECHFPDQKLAIKIVRDGWLHSGTIVCPACDAVCTPEQCHASDEAPPANKYPRDELTCDAPTPRASSWPLLLLLLCSGPLLHALLGTR